jgi:tRNA threonylcarbamoyladenosine biosynthesis protein TsaE
MPTPTMTNMQTFTFTCPTIEDTQALAAVIGSAVKGGEVIELTSDLGGGKTTFMKGFAKGMGITDVVQSPTFTISLIHPAPNGLELQHFDFYRLTEPGVMKAELAESLEQPNAVVAIEWGDIVHDILPANRITVDLTVPADETRTITITCQDGDVSNSLHNYQQNGQNK